MAADRLRSALGAAERRWPGVRLTEEELRAYVSERLDPTDSSAALEDLYLACACARGDPAALRHFDRELLADTQALLGQHRFDVSAAELRQAIRERLFLSQPGAPAKITTYRGQSGLFSWVRAVALRIALRLQEQRGPPPAEVDLLDLAADSTPEVSHLRQRYRTELDAALTQGLARLTARQRNLLRQQVVSGMSIEALARCYDVNRSSIVRWLADARAALAAAIREELTRLLKLEGDRLESYLRAALSNVDLSLGSQVEEEPR